MLHESMSLLSLSRARFVLADDDDYDDDGDMFISSNQAQRSCLGKTTIVGGCCHSGVVLGRRRADWRGGGVCHRTFLTGVCDVIFVCMGYVLNDYDNNKIKQAV